MTDIHPTTGRQQHKRRATKPAANLSKQNLILSENNAGAMHRRRLRHQIAAGSTWDPRPWGELSREQQRANESILAAAYNRPARRFEVMPKDEGEGMAPMMGLGMEEE